MGEQFNLANLCILNCDYKSLDNYQKFSNCYKLAMNTNFIAVNLLYTQSKQHSFVVQEVWPNSSMSDRLKTCLS